MDVHCIIEIFNGKQARQAFSMLTKIEVKQTIPTRLAQILSSRVYTLRHCIAGGCEYGWRDDGAVLF